MTLDLSIIIPTKNVETHISTCIDSILNQTFQNFEIIIVDFDSNDSTLSILKNYNSSRIKIHNTTTSGIYSAMNLGIEKASGRYCLFLGADDSLFNINVLDKIFLSKRNEDLLLGNVENINLSDSKIKSIYKNDFSKNLYWKNTIHHQGVFYKTELINQYKYNTEYNVLADYDLNLKLLNDSVSSSNIDIFIAKSNADGISKQFIRALYKEELKIKKRGLPTWAYLINLFVIPLKFIYKRSL